MDINNCKGADITLFDIQNEGGGKLRNGEPQTRSRDRGTVDRFRCAVNPPVSPQSMSEVGRALHLLRQGPF